MQIENSSVKQIVWELSRSLGDTIIYVVSLEAVFTKGERD